MSNNFFSPNKSINGGALFATFNSKDGSIYFRLLKQIADNPSKKDNFDGKNPINIKLSQDEAADIVRAIRTNLESKFYHKFENNTCTGNFKYYVIPAKGEFKERSGFGLSIKKTSGEKVQEVKIGFTLGSAERLSIFLVNALKHIMDYEHIEDMKRFEELRL